MLAEFAAAIKGESILNGMASGAVGGAIGGAIAGCVVDLFIAPGTSVVTALAVGAIGGAIGGGTSSMISQSTNYLLNNQTLNGFNMDWNSVAASASAGAIFGGIGGGLGQSQALAYNYEPLVGAMASGFATVANAAFEIINSSLQEIVKKLENKGAVIASVDINHNGYTVNYTHGRLKGGIGYVFG